MAKDGTGRKNRRVGANERGATELRYFRMDNDHAEVYLHLFPWTSLVVIRTRHITNTYIFHY